MVKNYLKTAIRSLTKNKVFSIINIGGLAIGLGAFLLIFQFVSFERSFDTFHENADQIYRIQFERIYATKHDKSAGLTAAAGPVLRDEFPEIEEVTKIHFAGYMTNTINVGDQQFIEPRLFYADDAFLEIFSFDLIEGSADKALEEVNSIALSEQTAMTYFGKTDVIGELITLENGWGEQTCKVTAVFENLPDNTHFDFNVLVSLESLHQLSGGQSNTSWGWNAFPTYIKLGAGADSEALEAKFPDFAQRNYTRIIERGVQPVLYLQPIQDIYLHSDLRFEVGPLGSNRVVKILTAVSLFIIVLAYFNYVNLATSKSLERAKEIGVRKVTGAKRTSLFSQFIIESFVVNLISIALGFTLMQLSLPFFETAVGKPLGDALGISQQLLVMIAIMLIAGTALSGFYPAWVMSRMQTIKVLKGVRTKSGSDAIVRKGLVVLQFTILCFLLIGSLTVRSQISYMLTSDRGFDSEQMIIVNGPSSSNNGAALTKSWKTQLTAIPEVIGVSNSTMIPGDEITWVNNNVRLATASEDEVSSMPFLGMDQNFVPNLSLEVVAGRNFSDEIKSDTASVMLSRAALGVFGFQTPEEALNQKIVDGGDEFLIVGVVENFHQRSFKAGYDPIIYRYVPLANNYYSIKVQGEDYPKLIANIEDVFKSLYPADSFNYFFLDEFFERQLKEDRTFAKVFDFFTLLGIWISCLGLFGLTSYAVSQRKKEIGIRKVLGASVSSVVLLISRSFGGLILMAILIAIPIAYYATGEWLSNYSFATQLTAYIFVVPVLIIALITMLTIGGISSRTATKNPVDSLRYE